MATPDNLNFPKGSGAPMLELADHIHPCVYRPQEQAKMPLLYPTRKLTPTEMDEQLAKGRRRSGSFVYYTACGNCRACEPTRLDLNEFQPSKSMKRILKAGDRVFRVMIGPPIHDERRLALFNLHRSGRGLATSDEPYQSTDFSSFLIDSCCDTLELSYWDGDRLVGCTIIDSGKNSISAVYTYYDPAYSRFSPGTYSILKQIQWAAQEAKQYVYLGMFVADNQHLRYKARFVRQQRFIRGQWVSIEDPLHDWARPRNYRSHATPQLPPLQASGSAKTAYKISPTPFEHEESEPK